MAGLSLKHIYKVYPNGTKAVNDFNMEIADKEFIVFVGPSGCGKSTTLRMIAGLEDISAGELLIGENVVNDMEPKDRDIAMVFQNYALYPHMTVFENIAFGLRLRKMPKDEINKRVTEAAEILGITEYLGKKPKEMSGGQRQRVSLGRAIVREPKVMLLDEPLSNLDAKLRTQMRSEIAKLHAKLQTTFIYVTHDQIEAMTMGTRIVVMKSGVIQQIDNPTNLFDFPENKFVAGFIGTPQMNFFDVTIKKNGKNLDVKYPNGETQSYNLANMRTIKPEYLDGNEHGVTLGIRGENITLDEQGISAKLSIKEILGNTTQMFVKITPESPDSIICVNDRNDYRQGDTVKILFDEKRIHLFDDKTELSIMERKYGN